MSRQGIDESAHPGHCIASICVMKARNSPLVVAFGGRAEIVAGFEAAHRQRYGFIVPEKAQIVEAVSVEVIGKTETVEDPEHDAAPRMLPIAAEGNGAHVGGRRRPRHPPRRTAL